MKKSYFRKILVCECTPPPLLNRNQHHHRDPFEAHASSLMVLPILCRHPFVRDPGIGIAYACLCLLMPHSTTSPDVTNTHAPTGPPSAAGSILTRAATPSSSRARRRPSRSSASSTKPSPLPPSAPPASPPPPTRTTLAEADSAAPNVLAGSSTPRWHRSRSPPTASSSRRATCQSVRRLFGRGVWQSMATPPSPT